MQQLIPSDKYQADINIHLGINTIVTLTDTPALPPTSPVETSYCHSVIDESVQPDPSVLLQLQLLLFQWEGTQPLEPDHK